MKNRIARKLKSRAGESIGETLVALLISALALVMLAGAMSAATRVILTSNSKMKEYYAGDSSLVSRSASASSISIKLEGGGVSQTVNGICYSNSAFGGNVVYAYDAIES